MLRGAFTLCPKDATDIPSSGLNVGLLRGDVRRLSEFAHSQTYSRPGQLELKRRDDRHGGSLPFRKPEARRLIGRSYDLAPPIAAHAARFLWIGLAPALSAKLGLLDPHLPSGEERRPFRFYPGLLPAGCGWRRRR